MLSEFHPPILQADDSTVSFRITSSVFLSIAVTALVLIEPMVLDSITLHPGYAQACFLFFPVVIPRGL